MAEKSGTRLLPIFFKNVYFFLRKKSFATLKIRLAMIRVKIPIPKNVLEIMPVKFQ